MTAAADADRREPPTAWDAFVEANPLGSYLQLSGWAAVKAVNGWTSRRLHDGDGADPAVGAQVLLRRPGPVAVGVRLCAPRPRARAMGRGRHRALHGAGPDGPGVRRVGAGRVSHLRIDPEIERGAGPDEGGAVTAALAAAGWRPRRRSSRSRRA